MWLYWKEPINVNYHAAKVGGQRHSGNRDIFKLFFAWLVSFESTTLHAKFGGHRFYGNRLIHLFNSDMNYYINTSEKAELNTSIRHNERFSKSKILFYNGTKTGRRTWKIANAFHTNVNNKNNLFICMIFYDIAFLENHVITLSLSYKK